MPHFSAFAAETPDRPAYIMANSGKVVTYAELDRRSNQVAHLLRASGVNRGDHIAIMKDGEISQIGTPEEIVANPADQYVKDFTEDVPKYKVLSAGKVMREAVSVNTKKLFKDRQHCVLESDKIDQLIDLISETDTPVPVTSANGKKLVGEIDRTIVMKAMSSRS